MSRREEEESPRLGGCVGKAWCPSGETALLTVVVLVWGRKDELCGTGYVYRLTTGEAGRTNKYSEADVRVCLKLRLQFYVVNGVVYVQDVRRQRKRHAQENNKRRQFLFLCAEQVTNAKQRRSPGQESSDLVLAI